MTRCAFIFRDGQRCQYPAGHTTLPASPDKAHSWELWIDEFVAAALRERDAAHEIALKRARADALNAAARLCAKEAERIKHTRHVDGIGMGWQAGEALALSLDLAIRALLEEAGK